MKTSSLKKAAIAIAAIIITAASTPEVNAQTNPDPSYFCADMYFERTEKNLGYYGRAWYGDVWLSKEPYKVFFGSRLANYAQNDRTQ
jgi:hypothetical protein